MNVLYIPGLPGSKLVHTELDKTIFLNVGMINPDRVVRDRLYTRLRGPNQLDADDPVRAGDPIVRAAKILLFDVAKQAGSLYRTLRKIPGVEIIPFGWDWRRPVWDRAHSWSVQPRLAKAIRDAAPVTVIVHSTGGLVLRKLLEQEPSLASSIHRVIAFGVPWGGLLKPLFHLHAKDGFFGGIVSTRRAQEVLAYAWAGYDLLPFGALPLVYRETPSGRQPVDPLANLDWIRSVPRSHLHPDIHLRAERSRQEMPPPSPMIELPGQHLEIVNVVGWGASTTVEAELLGNGSSSRIDVKDKSTGDSTLDGGDGTVPRISADWLRSSSTVSVVTHHVPIGRLPSTKRSPHSSLWLNPGGKALLRHHLGGEQLPPFAYAALDSSDTNEHTAATHVRVRLVALDAAGQPLPDAQVVTVRLLGGQIQSDFNVNNQGRHLCTIPRNRIRQKTGNTLRFRLKIRWTEQGRLKSQTRKFLFPR